MPRVLNCTCDVGKALQEEGKYSYDLCWAEFSRRLNLHALNYKISQRQATESYHAHSHIHLYNLYPDTHWIWTEVEAYDAGEAIAMALWLEERAALHGSEAEARIREGKRSYGRKIQFE